MRNEGGKCGYLICHTADFLCCQVYILPGVHYISSRKRLDQSLPSCDRCDRFSPDIDERGDEWCMNDTSWSKLCPENSQSLKDDGVFDDEVDNSFLIFSEGWRCPASCCMNNSKVPHFRVSSCLQATLIDFHLAIRIFIYFKSCKFRQSKKRSLSPDDLTRGDFSYSRWSRVW